MTNQEVAEQEIEAFKWMTKKGYDRKASKDISQILVKYLNEQLILHGVTKRNWFQRMPLHWRFIYYLIGGIIIGLLLPYVW